MILKFEQIIPLLYILFAGKSLQDIVSERIWQILKYLPMIFLGWNLMIKSH